MATGNCRCRPLAAATPTVPMSMDSLTCGSLAAACECPRVGAMTRSTHVWCSGPLLCLQVISKAGATRVAMAAVAMVAAMAKVAMARVATVAMVTTTMVAVAMAEATTTPGGTMAAARGVTEVVDTVGSCRGGGEVVRNRLYICYCCLFAV